jgi:hypothetical protein
MFQPVIQRSPLGLVDLFELKSGQTPSFLAEQIVPTVDVGDLYLLNGRESIQAAVVAGALGFGTFPDLNVPPGEIWWVWAYSVTSAAPLGAGQSCHAKATVRLGQINAQAFSPRVSATVGEVFSTEAAKRFYVGAGGGFGYVLESVVAGPISIGAVVTFTRLQI